MYEGLLLSTGGGIITDLKKSAQQGEPTIIIGLGGTGVDALKVVKKKVYEQLIPDNPAAAIPEYKHIGFLAIDTDTIDTGNGEVYSLEKSECLNISVDNLNRKLKEDTGNTDEEGKQPPQEFAWLQPSLSLNGESGAGTIRQIGRYCVFKNIDDITNKIRSVMTNVIMNTGTTKVNVHIIAGISGGTGSGTFIDICYIIRELMDGNAKLFGYFFMPDVNLNKQGIANTPLITNRIKNNGYAALKELDYTMNLEHEGKTFSQFYGGANMYSVKKTSEHLVDLCHLISSTDKKGAHISNGYMYSMNVVGEYILSYLSHVQVNTNNGTKVAPQTLEGHLANVQALVGAIKKKQGENLNYHILGASTAELPTREIGTYLASELYSRMKDGLTENKPNDHTVMEHADAMGLNLKSFRKKLYGKGDYQIYDARAIRWQGADDFSIEDILNTQIIVGDKVDDTNIAMTDRILRPARMWREKNAGILEENYQKLTRDLDDFTVIGQGTKATTLISTVFQYLQNTIVEDINYGAVYASKLTHNAQGQTLNDRLSGIIKEAKEAEKNCESDMGLMLGNIIAAVKFCREKCTGIFVTKKKQQEGVMRYRAAIRAYYQNVFDIEVYQTIREMAEKLKDQIDKESYPNSLYPKYFKPMEKMLLELRDTFAENSKFFDTPNTNEDEFVWKIVSFSEIRGNVDEQFKKWVSNTSAVYRDFIKKIMEQYDKWTDGDRRKVEKMITSYISEVFEPVLSASMDSYLNDKYGTHGNPQALQSKIQEDLLEEGVLAKAEPKFHINGAYTIAPAQKHDLTIPDVEANVKVAAQNIAKGSSLNIRCMTAQGAKKLASGRIVAVKFESGVPLYAYGLIDDLENQYVSMGASKGRHLYEITDRNRDIDWANLQSFIPYSVKPSACTDGKELEALYDVAEKKGIIVPDQFNSEEYDVYELNAPCKRNKNDFMKNGSLDAKELNAYIEELKEYIDSNGKLNIGDNANIKAVKKLLNDGTIDPVSKQNYKKKCRIDYFIRFRGLQEVVKESLKILDDVEKAIKEARKWQNEGVEREETIKLVTAALCFDFFKAEIGKYTYNGVDLWNGNMEYSKFPVYQIYKTFSSDAFTDAARKALENDVHNKLNALEATDVEKVEKVKAKYIDSANTGFINVMQQAAVLPESGDIETVYKLFNAEVQALLNLFAM